MTMLQNVETTSKTDEDRSGVSDVEVKKGKKESDKIVKNDSDHFKQTEKKVKNNNFFFCGFVVV